MIRSRIAPVVLAIAFAVLAGCAPAGRAPGTSTAPRLVLLYATCSLSKDYLSPYNDGVAYTPSLARFAQDGLVFDRHQTESGQSGVSFASLFTGTQATGHGVFSHPARLGDEQYMIGEAFRDAGYDLYGWLDHRMASAELNYAQGISPSQAFDGRLSADDKRFNQVLDRLESDPDYRVFIVTNFTVTHSPYKARLLGAFCRSHPDACAVRENDEDEFNRYRALYRGAFLDWSYDFDDTARGFDVGAEAVDTMSEVVETLYEASVFQLDRMFGAVLGEIAQRGLLDESLIVFTADHGEILRRDGALFNWSHGFQLAPEVLSVPMMLYGPGVVPGRYGAVSRSIDVFPTVAGLAGVEVRSALEGEDLSEAIRRPATVAPPERLGYSHTSLFSDEVWQRYSRYESLSSRFTQDDPEAIWVGARQGDRMFKIRRRADGKWETVAFDLASDPTETVDIFDPANAAHAEVAAALRNYKSALLAAHAKMPAKDMLDSERRLELLRSLGYVD